MMSQGDPQDFRAALFFHQTGQFDKAANIYREILEHNPENFDALHGLGLLEARAGNLERAKSLISRSLELQPANTQFRQNYATILCQTAQYELALQICDEALRSQPKNIYLLYVSAIALRKLKRLPESLQRFDRLLTVRPDHLVAVNERGCVLAEMKQFDKALAAFQKAIGLDPKFADAHLNVGNLYGELDRHEEAESSFEKVLALNPRLARAWSGLGIILRKRNHFDKALIAFDKALALDPNLAEAWLGRGNVFSDLKRFDEAFAAYDRALALKPDLAEAWLGRGNMFCECKRFDEAVAEYDKAIALKPDYARAFKNRGNIFKDLNRLEEAFANYNQAIALKPDSADAFYDRGSAFRDSGKWAEAEVDYERAIALKRDYPEAKLALCIAQLPILYKEEREIVERRAAYQQRLEALDVDQRRRACDWANAIGSSQPFFLAYQGCNDRDLQSAYGSLVCRIMADRYPRLPLSPPPRSDERIRLGIVSGFFCRHSNWKIPIRGWLSQIDRRQFQLFGYHTGLDNDAETQRAVGMCDQFVQGPFSVDRWREIIVANAPHVLIYPEVGMDPVSVQLAAQRLAPVQCNSWGHPDTSGFPTLDYYLSSELMEPPNALDHYTERLIRLPNLSIYYEPLDVPPVSLSRTDLGLRSTATIYWCGQSLYKYLPQFDEVFPRIARDVGDCQFVFIQYSKGTHVTDLFRMRLDKAFAAFGLRAADHCVVLPGLDVGTFLATMGQCDIFLDSIGWSGCNSTLEGLAHDLPIVTMTGPLMRGRHSTAILKMMKVEETITKTIDDYVSTATRLAGDTAWRVAIKSKISASKHRVYRDRSCIAALQEFLIRVARQQTSK
jgi:protein O-GlcNAc transferase